MSFLPGKHSVLSVKTNKQDCFPKNGNSFAKVLSNETLMKVEGGGDKVAVCLSAMCLESHVFIAPTLNSTTEF